MAARRVILPSADDLFRPTTPGSSTPEGRANGEQGGPLHGQATGQINGRVNGQLNGQVNGQATGQVSSRTPTRPSGRVRHDQKMTVYITSEELLEIEHARLALRRTHGLAVDRGRLVREAVAIVLADLEANGGDCALVSRLTGE